MDDAKLGELLLKGNRVSAAQLKTAVDFQKKVGGELGEILVKLGYVKDSVLAGIRGQSENVGAASIDANVIDLEAVRALPRSLLEKHQVIPLRSEDATVIVLAMQDPNNLQAIEEVQFLVNRVVEPAVAPKAAIRKALNQLDDLLRQAAAPKPAPAPVAAPPPGGLTPEKLRTIGAIPVDKLIRAYILVQIDKGHLSADELIQRAEKLG